ncbi:carbohydrate kinase family protein [Cycloclasticus pugetii]|uniref:carbohydrate kinase family protein n=1 Tax=Cycloclasticus pugetii TaxID=34068 RepID=UPI0009111DC8|nr:carbohydrate kinase family protein [Cycloclasticus pugetii]SHI66949.1 adenosine kinase [Cycloclasticus pugetii]
MSAVESKDINAEAGADMNAKPQSALICGSMAFDTIMVFPDKFQHHILPDKVHMLNVSFFVPELRREFGGCAGNIAYNLHLLGENALPMATVGKDFASYAQWMLKTGVKQDYLKVLEDDFTGQAYITSDMDDNQITAFHPGAMGRSELNKVPSDANISIGIVSPDGKAGMIEHAKQFVEAGIPFVFDPGQGMPMFDSDELKTFIEQATWVTLNDYEAAMLQEKTGLSPHEIAEQVEALIITKGAEGSLVYTKTERIDIPPAKATALVDPTGCGDAYRGGLLYGLMNGLDWEVTGRIAGLMGAIKIAHAGTQNHVVTLDELKMQYAEQFGSSF